MSTPLQGAELFTEQLKSLGIQAVVDGNWVEFEFLVPGGTYAGTKVQLAINVPPQFPAVAPPGIEFTPRMPGRPIRGGDHPERSHKSKRFPKDGEYWSRPHKAWNEETRKDAVGYMSFVRNLWITT